jgi:WD40 repeat protein/serine/threonine protein kinase/tetratricopeptide (TPR) repeat protein
MSPAETVFFAALAKVDPAERAAYLDEACGSDADLRRRVDRLLAAYPLVGSFLREGSAVDPSPVGGAGLEVRDCATVDAPIIGEQSGTVIGPYKLLEPIGEGGMGTVYMAEQTAPVRRLVALKVIKAGMDSRQVLARFGAERQALALMDHPNIAKVFDAGTTDTGRPYFVMELVKGIPITRFCDERRLTTRERLELAIPVCHAVQHAHQKGVIHRDLKPSNVLIALYDGKPVPKVIDFGVAKATGPRLTDQTLYTEFGAVVGTLEYMSPEQADLNQLDIDTRSDIYSLGVLLYELLTGSTPLDRKRLKQGAILEMLRVIREDESLRPSMRLDTTEELPSIAACRSIEPQKLSGLVRGELDWIVMKALEKDRTRRYETASGLAADLRRYLDDEPVQACPPSAWYRFRKIARRNRAVILTAAVVLAALVLGTFVSTWQAVRATRANELAETRLKAEEQAHREAEGARHEAQDSATRAETQRQSAVEHEKVAKEQELLARRRFYAAQMNLANQAWETGNPARVLELLEGQRPKFDQQDLRSFEWYYLWRLCHMGCRFTLRGHMSQVNRVVFSPDGATVASAGDDGAVRLWNVATGKEQALLKGPTMRFWSVAYSPDGKTLAACSYEGAVKLWNVVTGQDRLVIWQHTNQHGVRGLAFSPDGTTLATVAEGSTLKFWDVTTGGERADLHVNELLHVAFAPDGDTLAASGADGAVKLWSRGDAGWQERMTIKVDAWAPPIAFSGNGKTLATVAGNSVKLWDPATGKAYAEFQGQTGGVSSVAFSPDGKAVVLGSKDRTVRLWNVAPTGLVRTVGVHHDAVNSVAFSPNGQTVASGSVDGTVKLWDVTISSDSSTLPHSGEVISVAFTPDSKTLISGGDCPTKLWDVATGRERATLPIQAGNLGLALSPDGKSFAATGPEKTVKLWEVATGRERATFNVQTDGSGVSFSPDGKTLATWKPWLAPATVTLWDVATQQGRGVFSGVEASLASLSTLGVTFSPDGKTLAAAYEFIYVRVWDVASGKIRFTLRQGQTAFVTASAVRFSPDGKLLATGTDAGRVWLWDAATGQLRVSFNGHTDPIRAIVFSPDGQTLVTASDDKSVKLWDVATGQERMTLQGHTGGVRSLAFSGDGDTLATASTDGTVKLWRTATDEEARAFRMESDPHDPDSTAAQNDAGGRLWQTGKLHEAEKAYLKALARLEKLVASFPSISEYRQELARTYFSLSLLLARTDRAQEAEQDYRLAMALQDKLPANYHFPLALRYYNLGMMLITAGHLEEAERALGQATDLAPQVLTFWLARASAHLGLNQREQAITDYSKYLELWPNQADAWIYRGEVYFGMHRFDEALADYLKAVEVAPASALARNNLAWFLATCPEVKLRDASRGVEMAKKAVELAPKERTYWNTLGVAHYRAGDWKGAIEALTKSMEFGKGGDANDWFFLAMAHSQVGEKPQARSWYDRAVPWMERNQPTNKELLRFRDEAAALLGVKAKKK